MSNNFRELLISLGEEGVREACAASGLSPEQLVVACELSPDGCPGLGAEQALLLDKASGGVLKFWKSCRFDWSYVLRRLTRAHERGELS